MKELANLQTYIETANNPATIAILADPEITKLITRNKWTIDNHSLVPNCVVLMSTQTATTSPRGMQALTAKLSKLVKAKNLNYQVQDVGIFYAGVYSLRIIMADRYSDIVKGREKLFASLIERFV